MVKINGTGAAIDRGRGLGFWLRKGVSRRLADTLINILRKRKTVFTNIYICDILILTGGMRRGKDRETAPSLA